MATNGFSIQSYDKGGKGAIAGDGQLTGAEVKKAIKDGYTNIWEGYTANDPIPENPKLQAKEAKEAEKAEKKKLDFDKFDIGGKDAIAGDGKLTGDEATRAIQAGYDRLYDGITKENVEKSDYYKTKRNDSFFTMGITRAVANKTDNRFLRGAASVVDLIALPLAFGADMIRAVTSSDE